VDGKLDKPVSTSIILHMIANANSDFRRVLRTQQGPVDPTGSITVFTYTRWLGLLHKPRPDLSRAARWDTPSRANGIASTIRASRELRAASLLSPHVFNILMLTGGSSLTPANHHFTTRGGQARNLRIKDISAPLSSL